jgi:hypothetical protein
LSPETRRASRISSSSISMFVRIAVSLCPIGPFYPHSDGTRLPQGPRPRPVIFARLDPARFRLLFGCYGGFNSLD